jgi:hypothetical protein
MIWAASRMTTLSFHFDELKMAARQSTTSINRERISAHRFGFSCIQKKRDIICPKIMIANRRRDVLDFSVISGIFF